MKTTHLSPSSWVGLATSLLIALMLPGMASSAPNISINNVSVNEGSTAIFSVSIDNRPLSGQTINLQLTTRDGTAISGSDYTKKSGKLSFSRSNCPSTTCVKTFSVPTINDTLPETNETFAVTLSLTSASSTGTIRQGTGTATIMDNDQPANRTPTCSISAPLANTILLPGQSTAFVATANDPDGDTLSYAWTFPGGTPMSATTSSAAAAFATAGSYTATVNVNDGHGGTCQATRQITVNTPPTCTILTPAADIGIAAGGTVDLTATVVDVDGNPLAISWTMPGGTPASSTLEDPGTVTFNAAGSYTVTLNAIDSLGAACAAQTRKVTVRTVPSASINSTSEDSTGPVSSAVIPPPKVTSTSYSMLAVNDLGMHCTDLDARVANILPPFQVLLSQFIQKGAKPTLNPQGYSFYYSAASNPNDPFLKRTDVFNGIKADGTTFKGNFIQAVNGGSYDAFYPGIDPFSGGAVPRLSQWPTPVTPDLGLPVPNIENLYIGPDGSIKSGDEFIVEPGQSLPEALPQHAMPGIKDPYLANDAQKLQEHYGNKPFFVDFKFGYVAAGVNWNEAAGIPLAPFDDAGRQNPYPLIRLQAKNTSNTTVATVDTVLPVSAEASCANCHGHPDDVVDLRTGQPYATLDTAKLPIVSSRMDPKQELPTDVRREWAADVNILRLHDLKHGEAYVNTANEPSACDIKTNGPNGNPNCLTNRALVQGQSIVCQTCHYTPALDLAQVGPMSGASGTFANGRNQVAHQTNSRVMHNFHGKFTNLFTTIPAPVQDSTTGVVLNQTDRLNALQNNCYQCHPGKETNCLRGAMFNGGVLCSDCHGRLDQVGNDFSREVSTQTPGRFIVAGDFYTNPATPRVPWANEPGCGSCHTGDAVNNMASQDGVMPNSVDSHGYKDGIRLRMAFRPADEKATPIVPANKVFAEPAVPAQFKANSSSLAFDNPGAGNPQLYRLSTGHGGVMCEGCHGPTHAEWPVAKTDANDNQTALQLQGHVGTISECTVCHTTSTMSSTTQGGPHGMHLVNDVRWVQNHKDVAKAQNKLPNRGSCALCHGVDHKGTVLARAPVARNFSVEDGTRTVSLPAGKPVGCDACHSLSDSFN